MFLNFTDKIVDKQYRQTGKYCFKWEGPEFSLERDDSVIEKVKLKR